jgi:hypothetical protein
MRRLFYERTVFEWFVLHASGFASGPSVIIIVHVQTIFCMPLSIRGMHHSVYATAQKVGNRPASLFEGAGVEKEETTLQNAISFISPNGFNNAVMGALSKMTIPGWLLFLVETATTAELQCAANAR